MNKSSFLPAVLAGMGVALAASSFTPAHAFSISQTGGMAGNPSQPLWQIGITNSDVGDTFKVDWSVPDPALSAFANFNVVSLNGTSLVLDVFIKNTTNLATSGLQNAGLTSFGFGVLGGGNNNATISNDAAGGTTWSVGDGVGAPLNFPGGFSGIDICVFGQGCAGGSQPSALAAGTQDSFRLNIGLKSGNFNSNGEVTLAFFPAKFQTSLDSYQPAGQFNAGVNRVDAPEPFTILGTGAALGFSAMFQRERNKRQRKAEVKA